MFRRKRSDSDFSQEVQSHIELEAERLRDEGLSESDALAAAKKQFGNVLSAQERFHEAGRWLWLEHLRRDVGYGLRTLRRNPGFAAVATLSLGLGIGANALMFSVVNSLLLRPLPVEKPEQLVFLSTVRYQAGQSFPNYRDVRDRNQVFSGLLGYRVVRVEMESHDSPERTWGYLATGNYFDVLGVRPALGRFFHPEDDLRPGASPYAVLSYGSWRTRFGGDPQIVGKIIRINRQPYTVLGVAPREFHGTELFYWPEVWVPMMMQAQIEPGNPWLEARRSFNTWIVGRLNPGVTPEQATANLNTIAAALEREYPAENEGMRFILTRPGLAGDIIRGPVRAPLWGVLGLSALVLLTACANLISVILARSADRQRETAIRLSIGATRWRIVRQFLTETLVLASLGGVAGYGLATLLASLLSAWHAPMDFPVQFDVRPDWRVFLFACGVSLLAGVVSGMAPARRAAGTNPNAVLKGEQAGWRGGRLAARDVLVMTQVALCFVLVSACLLSLRSLQKAWTMPLGFRPEGVIAAGFDLSLAGYSEEKGRIFQQRALEMVGQIPGVQAAAYSNSVPLSLDQSSSDIYPLDEPALTPSQAKAAFLYEVSPRFFETLGIHVVAGRDFTWKDDRKGVQVAIINRAFARQVLGTETPLGKRFRLGPGGQPIEVIGTVEDGKYVTVTESPRPALFLPMLQNPNPTTTLMVRSSLPEQETLVRMRQGLAQLDPDLPLYGTGNLTQVLGFAFFPARAAAIALSGFGALAIMLAVTGIHGLVSYSVAARIREIGIRMAIGASRAQIVQLVIGRTVKLLAAGSAVGLFVTLAAGRLLSNLAYGVSPRDPFTLFAVCVTLGLLGALSSWPPTHRALQINPTAALRHE